MSTRSKSAKHRSFVSNTSSGIAGACASRKRVRVHANPPHIEAESVLPSNPNSKRMNEKVASTTIPQIPIVGKSTTDAHTQRLTTNLLIPNDATLETMMTDTSNSAAVQGQAGSIKKTRGKSRGLNADKVQEQLGKRLPIIIEEVIGRPTGPFASMFANEIGFTIRKHAPLNVEQWKNVTPEDTLSLVKRLTATGTGEMLGAIELFESHYKSEKKGWDLHAKEKYDEMVLLRIETTKEDGTRTMTDDGICKQVLGPKSGYIKGCGFGPRPAPAKPSQSSLHDMYEKNKALEDRIKDQNAQINALEEKTKRFEEFMANFNSQPPLDH